MSGNDGLRQHPFRSPRLSGCAPQQCCRIRNRIRNTYRNKLITRFGNRIRKQIQNQVQKQIQEQDQETCRKRQSRN